MYRSLPGPSIHGILQARILQWAAFPFQGIFLTQGYNLSRLVSCIGRWVLYHQHHLGRPRYPRHPQVLNTTLHTGGIKYGSGEKQMKDRNPFVFSFGLPWWLRG